jgi:hypothetical protein
MILFNLVSDLLYAVVDPTLSAAKGPQRPHSLERSSPQARTSN